MPAKGDTPPKVRKVLYIDPDRWDQVEAIAKEKGVKATDAARWLMSTAIDDHLKASGGVAILSIKAQKAAQPRDGPQQPML